MAVTLINVLTVPARKEDEFVKWWHDVKGMITTQPGFINGKIHRSINLDSNSTSFTWRFGRTRKYIGNSVTPMKTTLEQLGVKMVPALYHVAFEY